MNTHVERYLSKEPALVWVTPLAGGRRLLLGSTHLVEETVIAAPVGRRNFQESNGGMLDAGVAIRSVTAALTFAEVQQAPEMCGVEFSVAIESSEWIIRYFRACFHPRAGLSSSGTSHWALSARADADRPGTGLTQYRETFSNG